MSGGVGGWCSLRRREKKSQIATVLIIFFQGEGHNYELTLDIDGKCMFKYVRQKLR